jgi:hypothetical protein
LRLQQEFQVVRGTMRAEDHEVPITNATLTGDQLRFTASLGGQAQMSFDGRIEANLLHGNVEIRGGVREGRHNWVAQRETVDPGAGQPR